MQRRVLKGFLRVSVAVVALAACVPVDGLQTSQTPGHKPAPQAKPYIFSKEKGLSPLEQHMRARGMVDPADTSPTHRYTYLAEDYQQRFAGRVNEDGGVPTNSGMVVPKKKPSRTFAKVLAALTPDKTVTPESKPRAAKAKAPAPKKTSISPKPARKAVVASAQKTSASVTAFRVGQHPDKTRLVLDLNAKVPFDFQMDEKKNVLVVKLPDTAWDTDVKRVFSTHPLLLAYLAKPVPEGGTFLAIKMKKKAKLLFKSIFPPSGGRGYRIVLDVAPA